ncbi:MULTISPECIES: hypothetical protein [Actinosynnema]|uniref:Uncharacterized protein n=2 Tax=Actinosynnema TaxID=40566 RepID=C6WKN4_ACTMD|nr:MULTISPECIES: hypothetical protein [Actinosynnema]ACU40285.1 hypothetical protein Amir_6484 [Actinosynnema mirum DSM 43827]AXX33798.1 hypothetical protein APASM_6433 [Actinosynnema pretiosum subsp. pretiosum]MCP2095375.1 hypothetical protein [Actinosynnema pretiosum]QUF02438.1 hypothetical protein KCV87_23555 [Actinosynnema pretiosum subsp. pretiosum]
MSDANDWTWIRLVALQHVSDGALPARRRIAWGAVGLAASYGAERYSHRRTPSVVERFTLRGHLLELGAETPDHLAADVLSETAMTAEEAAERAATAALPRSEVKVLREHRSITAVLDAVAPLVDDADLRERARRWVEVRAALP